MSRRIPLSWCKRCAKPPCEDGVTGCPFKDSVKLYKKWLNDAKTDEEKERIQKRWRELEEPTIRDCLTGRYFMWLKYCRLGAEKLAQDFFDVPCDPEYYFFPEKPKKTESLLKEKRL